MGLGTVDEQTVLGAVDFDGGTVGTGLLELSALRVRPERVVLLSVYYVTPSTVKDLILEISPPDRPTERALQAGPVAVRLTDRDFYE